MNPLKQNAPIDPATGMPVAQPQLGQMAQNPYPNQNALGPAQAAKIPSMFPGSAFQQNQKTYGILSADTSKKAAASEAARLAAQEKAKKERALREEASNGVTEATTEASQEILATLEAKKVKAKQSKTIPTPPRTYSNSSSKTIYNEDGTVSSKQTIK